MITIGQQPIGTNVFLSPLSACSDLAFRLIAREYGARFCFFEMLEAKSLVYGSPRSDRILRTCEQDRPIAAQLLGIDPDSMVRATEIILKRAPITFLDINAACPARKVCKKGSGASLLKDPSPLCNVIETLRKTFSIPITIKMRVGYDQLDIPGSVRFAKICESAGASAIFVHGRTRPQENYGEVHYEAIKAVKDSVGIPVLGSGNILNPPLAKKMFDQTGCDGILIAKGSFGNPYIYNEIEEYLRTGTWTPRVDLHEKITVLKKHLLLAKSIDGERLSRRIGELGKICLWYLKGFAQASRYRARIFSSKNEQELFGLIDRLLESPNYENTAA